jgi:hypothetical protein
MDLDSILKNKPKFGPVRNRTLNAIFTRSRAGGAGNSKANIKALEEIQRELEKSANGAKGPTVQKRLDWLRYFSRAVTRKNATVASTAPVNKNVIVINNHNNMDDLAASMAGVRINKPIHKQSITIQTSPVKVKKTLDNGDCFYSSIYRAAKERDILQLIGDSLHIDTNNETVFITEMRRRVADHIRAGHLPKENGINVDAFNMLTTYEPETYTEILKSYPKWFQDKFSGGTGSRQSFLQRLAAESEKRYQWVGELEFRIVQSILRDNSAVLLESTTLKVSQIPLTRDDMPLITLYNPSESHYEYYSPVVETRMSKKAENKGTSTVKLLGQSIRYTINRDTERYSDGALGGIGPFEGEIVGFIVKHGGDMKRVAGGEYDNPYLAIVPAPVGKTATDGLWQEPIRAQYQVKGLSMASGSRRGSAVTRKRK